MGMEYGTGVAPRGVRIAQWLMQCSNPAVPSFYGVLMTGFKPGIYCVVPEEHIFVVVYAGMDIDKRGRSYHQFAYADENGATLIKTSSSISLPLPLNINNVIYIGEF